MKTDLDEFHKVIIRRSLTQFHLERGERPTVKNLLPILKDKILLKETVGLAVQLWKMYCVGGKTEIKKKNRLTEK